MKKSYKMGVHKLVITNYSQQATQLMKIYNTLPVLCTDKGYKYPNNVIQNNGELDKKTHIPTYSAATEWLVAINVKIDMVNQTTALDVDGVLPVIKCLTTKTHVLNENLQKQKIAEYKLQEALKQQE